MGLALRNAAPIIHCMGIRLLLSLALVLAPLAAWPQSESAPIQTAQAEEKAATVEPAVVLPPDTGIPIGVLVGIGLVAGVLLLGGSMIHSCDDSGDCGGLPPVTTGTR